MGRHDGPYPAGADNITRVADDVGAFQRIAPDAPPILEGLGVPERDHAGDSDLDVFRKRLDCAVGDGRSLAILRC